MTSTTTHAQAPVFAHRWPLAVFLSIGLAVLPIILTGGLLLLWERIADVDVHVAWLVVGLLVARQLTAFTISVHLHRSVAHRQFEFHPVLEVPMRIWNFFFQGSTRVWSVMHRIHHANEDTAADPHSPVKEGGSLANILQQTSASYFSVARALQNGDTLARYDVGLPNDAFERFAVRASSRGVVSVVLARIPLLLAVLTLVFGFPVGAILLFGNILSIWASTIFVINGLSHRIGYRTMNGAGHSMNTLPVDFVSWGELLHHNHHAFPGRPNLAVSAGEFDPGYWVVEKLARVGLVRNLNRP
jgi:stearoyl-CoA desaturase (delta-9 desaturase)